MNIKSELYCEIIDVFEDFLFSKGIEINNPEKADNEDAAIIYGSDYFMMEESIKRILTNWELIEPSDDEEDYKESSTIVYPEDVSGYVGAWLDSDTDNLPKKLVQGLQKVYTMAVNML